MKSVFSRRDLYPECQMCQFTLQSCRALCESILMLDEILSQALQRKCLVWPRYDEIFPDELSHMTRVDKLSGRGI